MLAGVECEVRFEWRIFGKDNFEALGWWKICHRSLLSVPFTWDFVEVALVRLGLRDGPGFDDGYAPCPFFVSDLIEVEDAMVGNIS